MAETPRERADLRLQRALDDLDLEDPREPFRERLRDLRNRDAAAFERARRHYAEVLVPRVADEAADPLAEWLEYGRMLAGPGRTMAIDPTGRARPFRGGLDAGTLLLHLPEAPGRAMLLLRPRSVSAPQEATIDLLVQGKLR